MSAKIYFFNPELSNKITNSGRAQMKKISDLLNSEVENISNMNPKSILSYDELMDCFCNGDLNTINRECRRYGKIVDECDFEEDFQLIRKSKYEHQGQFWTITKVNGDVKTIRI